MSDDVAALNSVPTEEGLNQLQLTTLQYYLHESNPANGLIRDKTDPSAPCSIAAVGLALATIPVLVERGVISREFAPEVALRTLRFFHDSPQGPEADATGYKGFYYHFLDMKTGRRVWECELSTIDSAFLFAGMLTCAAYFDADTEDESEVRRLADELYRRADWQWVLVGGAAVSHGWRPETGFLPHTWTGYDEALLVYLLGLGSPTFPLPGESYAAYCSTYHCWGITATDGPGWETRRVNGIERQFFGYHARGVPYGPDDGTLAPWVAVASLPFAPEIVIPTIRAMARLELGATTRYGFKPSFNQTYAVPDSPTGWWVTPYHFGIDQGPVALMIENYRTGLIWEIMRRCPYVKVGLRRAGFRGSWL